MNDSLSCFPNDRRSQADPINVSIPLQQSAHAYDCKPETIETLLSLLELRAEGKVALAHVEGTSYDCATIAPKRRRMDEIAKKEPLAQVILACGTCVEPPAGESVLTDRSLYGHNNSAAVNRTGPTQVVGHSYGTYTISVAKCANLLGPAAEPRHVFAALRRLQSTGELEVSVDTSAGGRALTLKVSGDGKRVFGVSDRDGDDGAMDKITDEVLNAFVSTVNASASKVLELNSIMLQVSEASANEGPSSESSKLLLRAAATAKKSPSLSLFQNLIHKYFVTEGGLGEKQSSASEDSNVEPHSDSHFPGIMAMPSRHELQADVSAAFSQLLNVQAASTGTGQNAVENNVVQLDLSNKATADYVCLTLTKFLHGIVPARMHPPLLRNHFLFGRHQGVPFWELHNAIAEVLGPTHLRNDR